MWNLATCSSENGKYAESIIDDLMITCDKNIEETKGTWTQTVPASFNEKG